MATAKKTEAEATAAAAGVEKVKVKLPRTSGTESQVYVSVNDYSCVIPRGVEVEVPVFVKEELDRAEAAREAFLFKSDELLMH